MYIQQSDAGNDLHLIYLAPEQSCQSLLDDIQDRVNGQRLSVLVVLPAQSVQVFRRSDDFVVLKYLERQLGIHLLLVIPDNGPLRRWAERYGFATYASQSEFLNQQEKNLLPLNEAPLPPNPVPSRTEFSKVSSPLPVSESGSCRQDIQDRLIVLEDREDQEKDREQPSLPIPPLYSAMFERPDQEMKPIKASSAFSASKKDDYVAQDARHAASREQREHEERSIFSSQRAQPPALSTLVPDSSWKLRWVRNALALFALGMLLCTGTLFALRQFAASSSRLIGYVYFQSSGQLDQAGDQGLNDRLIIDLQHLAAPAWGKSYHAWLLGDENSRNAQAIYLGQMDLTNGNAHLSYTAPQHENLLITSSRFLVTEDYPRFIPSYPSNQSTWRYEGTIPQTPDPNDIVHHYSLLDHLRHLLASEPTLAQLGLKGGLDTWFYKDSLQIPILTGSARDAWANGSTTLIQNQVIRTLDYLDGLNEVQADLPASTPFLADRVQNRIGLLELNGGDIDQPGLIYQMQVHLSSLDLTPGRSEEQHILAGQIVNALNNTQDWLLQVRQIAQQLVGMSHQQLLSSQAHTLLDNMVTAANNAFAGTKDSATGNVQAGALWVHATVQRLASIPVMQL